MGQSAWGDQAGENLKLEENWGGEYQHGGVICTRGGTRPPCSVSGSASNPSRRAGAESARRETPSRHNFVETNWPTSVAVSAPPPGRGALGRGSGDDLRVNFAHPPTLWREREIGAGSGCHAWVMLPGPFAGRAALQLRSRRTLGPSPRLMTPDRRGFRTGALTGMAWSSGCSHRSPS